jgi:hypothetical protein
MTRLLLAAALAASAWPLAGPALADTVVFNAMLDGQTEVPPKQTAGRGDATAVLDTDTRQLDYTVTFHDLTGPATMAHFHGPAAPGANAGVAVPLGMAPKSPIKGDVTLTPAQVTDLMAGRWYVNVHTAANPKGEIRGQMILAK